MYLQQMSVVDECFGSGKQKLSLHAFVVPSHWAEGNDAAGLRLAIASAKVGLRIQGISHTVHAVVLTIGSSALTFGNFFRNRTSISEDTFPVPLYSKAFCFPSQRCCRASGNTINGAAVKSQSSQQVLFLPL